MEENDDKTYQFHNFYFHNFQNIAGDLANGTSVTHMVNKMEVVQYLKKIYGPKTSERKQKSIKGTLIDFLDAMIFSIFFIYSFYYYISFL